MSGRATDGEALRIACMSQCAMRCFIVSSYRSVASARDQTSLDDLATYTNDMSAHVIPLSRHASSIRLDLGADHHLLYVSGIPDSFIRRSLQSATSATAYAQPRKGYTTNPMTAFSTIL